jgi:hypothetical protein
MLNQQLPLTDLYLNNNGGGFVDHQHPHHDQQPNPFFNDLLNSI